jgi:predicted nucleotidyltransferase/biotin operon repressor
MHPARWTEAAFGSESRIRILRLLAGSPLKPRTERDIAKAIGMSPNAVNRAIRTLRDAGLITVERLGNAHAVRLRADEAFLTMLRRVFATEDEWWSEAVKTIERSVPTDAACYLFGSSARGTAHADSDVDLLVVAKDRKRASEAALAIQSKLHDALPVRLHVVALGISEAKRRMRATRSVVKSAVEEGIHLGARGFDDFVSA